MGTKEDNLRVGSDATLEIQCWSTPESEKLRCCYAALASMKLALRSRIPIWKAVIACAIWLSGSF